MLVNALAGFAVPLAVGLWSDRRAYGRLGARTPFILGGTLLTVGRTARDRTGHRQLLSLPRARRHGGLRRAQHDGHRPPGSRPGGLRRPASSRGHQRPGAGHAPRRARRAAARRRAGGVVGADALPRRGARPAAPGRPHVCRRVAPPPPGAPDPRGLQLQTASAAGRPGGRAQGAGPARGPDRADVVGGRLRRPAGVLHPLRERHPLLARGHGVRRARGLRPPHRGRHAGRRARRAGARLPPPPPRGRAPRRRAAGRRGREQPGRRGRPVRGRRGGDGARDRARLPVLRPLHPAGGGGALQRPLLLGPCGGGGRGSARRRRGDRGHGLLPLVAGPGRDCARGADPARDGRASPP